MPASPHYKADLTAGSLKPAESRVIADLLLRQVSNEEWKRQIVTQNVLQVRHPATATRLTRLIRGRLETMGPELWRLVRDGTGVVPLQALLAAAVKHSLLLADFLELVVAEQYRLFQTRLSPTLFTSFLEGCRERDPQLAEWSPATCRRLRSSLFQILAQAGYLENTRTLRLQPVHIAPQVVHYLSAHHETAVLRCLQISP